MRSYVLPVVILLTASTVLASGEDFASRLRRAVRLPSCESSFAKCERHERCSAALEKFEERCKVTNDRCNANMKDLPRCGQIMDHLFHYGFPQEKCACLKSDVNCLRNRTRLYENPCFAAIRMLRSKNLFPKNVDAYDRVTKPETTSTTTTMPTTTVFIAALYTGKFSKPLIERTEFGVDSIRHTDDKISHLSGDNTLPPTANNVADITSKKGDTIGNEQYAVVITTQSQDVAVGKKFEPYQASSNKAQFPDNEHQPSVVEIPVQIPPRQADKYYSEGHSREPYTMNNENEFSLSTVQRRLSGEIVLRRELIKTTTNTDYKSMAIILGILLGLVVLCSVIIVLWTRSSDIILYKGAKFMKDRRTEDDDSLSTVLKLHPASPARC